MEVRNRIFPPWFALLLGLGLLLTLLSACQRPQPELDEKEMPAFRRGQSLLKQGRDAEALAAFLAVIASRTYAPESHLEAGLIYLNTIKDPLAATYHFRSFLEARPDGENSAGVRDLLNRSIREFALTLPGNPFAPQVDRQQLQEQVQQLQAENTTLRSQLAAYQTEIGRAPPATATTVPTENVPYTTPVPYTPPARPIATAPAAPPRTVATQPATPPQAPPPTATYPRPVAARPTPPAPAPVVTAPSAAPAAAPRPAEASSGVYTVQPGDTLTSISRKVYGTPSRWRDIFEVNRGLLPAPNALKVGQQLRLPR